MTNTQEAVASAYALLVKSPGATLVLGDLITYTHTLPETLQLGANHLLNHIQFKALALDREKRREKESKRG